MTIPKRISASIMPIFKSIRPSILIDAGVIVSAFYLTNAYFSEEAAIPLSVLLFLLWSRGWALNGETRGKAAVVSMVVMLGFAWAIHADLIVGQRVEEVPAPGDAQWDNAAAAVVGNPYVDLMDQEAHRKRVDAEISSYEQTERFKREDEAIKRESECLAKHKSGSREMRDCLMESKREALGLDPAWGALPELPE